jgi:hypothetical protein
MKEKRDGEKKDARLLVERGLDETEGVDNVVDTLLTLLELLLGLLSGTVGQEEVNSSLR